MMDQLRRVLVSQPLVCYSIMANALKTNLATWLWSSSGYSVKSLGRGDEVQFECLFLYETGLASTTFMCVATYYWIPYRSVSYDLTLTPFSRWNTCTVLYWLYLETLSIDLLSQSSVQVGRYTKSINRIRLLVAATPIACWVDGRKQLHALHCLYISMCRSWPVNHPSPPLILSHSTHADRAIELDPSNHVFYSNRRWGVVKQIVHTSIWMFASIDYMIHPSSRLLIYRRSYT